MFKDIRSRIILLALLLVWANAGLRAQGKSATDDPLKAEAAKLFDRGDFQAAMPKYSQLLSLYPRDPEFNYRFGVCLFYANSNPESPIKYLLFAKKELPQKAEIYYYLGRVYHVNYRFSEAIQEYSRFQSLAPTLVKKWDVSHSLEMCRNGINLLSKINDIYVFQKREVREAGFYRSYDAACFGGRFYPKSDNLKTKLDKTRESGGSLMFVLNSKNEIYYASYGKKGETGKDIYHVTKLPDGKWGEPERLSDVINTPYDEDFPYLQPDGKTLYFSSKGHNSMGGYDIFRTVYNTREKQWVKPVNMDFAINTPYDEMLFVPDTLEQYAFFSSNRLNTRGDVTLFKVRIDKRPDKTENIDLAVGVSSPSDTAEMMKMITMLKEKASLDVNATEDMFVNNVVLQIDSNNIAPVDTANEWDRLLDSGKLTNAEIITIAKKEADKAKEEVKPLREKYNASVALSAQRNKEAEDLKKEADDLKRQAQSVEDPVQKMELEQKAEDKLNQYLQKKKEGALSYNLAVKFKNALLEKAADAENQDKFVNALQKANDAQDPRKSNQVLNEYIAYLQKTDSDVNKGKLNVDGLAPSRDDYTLKKNEADELQGQLKGLKESVADLELQAQNARNDAGRTKKKETRDALLKQAADLDEQAKKMNESLKPLVDRVVKANREADSVLNEMNVLSGVMRTISDSGKQLSTVKVSDGEKNTLDNEFKNKNHLTVNYSAYKPENKSPGDASQKESALKVAVIKAKRDSVAKARDAAYLIAMDKESQSKKYSDEVDQRMNRLESITDPNQKQKELNAINKRIDEARKLQGESRIAYEIAQKLDSLTKTAEDALVQAEKLNEEIKSGNLADDEKQSRLNNMNTLVANVNYSIRIVDLAPVAISDIKKKAAGAQNQTDALEQNIQTLKARLAELKNEYNNPGTKKKRRAEIEKQMQVVNVDIQNKTNQKDNIAVEADRMKSDALLVEAASGYEISKDWNTALKNTRVVTDPERIALKNSGQPSRVVQQKDSLMNIAAVHNIGVVEPTADNNAKLEASVNNNIGKQNGNKTLINSLQSGNRNNPDALQARQLTDESDQLISKANALLADAGKSTDLVQRSELLSEADNLTNQALEKQLRAIELYQKNYDPTLTVNRNHTDSLLTVQLREFELKAKANMDQYQRDRKEMEKLIPRDGGGPDYLKALLWDKEADSLNAQAFAAQNAARNENDPEKKKKLLNDAMQLSFLSLDRISKAVEAYRNSAAVANNANNNNNANNANNANNTNNANNNNNNVSSMNESSLRITEVKNLRSEARTIREQAKSITDPTRRKEELEKAKALEADATEKERLAHVAGFNEMKATYDAKEKVIGQIKPLNNTVDRNGIALLQRRIDNELGQALELETKAKKEKDPVKSNEYLRKGQQLLAQAMNRQDEIVRIAAKEQPGIADANDQVKGNRTPMIPLTQQDYNTTAYNSNNTNNNANNNTNNNNTNNTNNTNNANNTVNVVRVNAVNYESEYASLSASGLIFRVQIASVKELVSASRFANAQPVGFEKMNNGWLTIISGMYASPDQAADARNQLRTKGYGDCFVVAYQDGKRISMAEARTLYQKNNPTYANNTNNNANNNTNNTNNTNNNANNNNNNNANNNVNNNTNNANNNVVKDTNRTVSVNANNVVANGPLNAVEGLYYTVQVGVYSKEKTSDQLLGIAPLEFDVTPKGYYRYMSGKYNFIMEADKYRKEIVAKGVPDAFVVAYYQGKRISLFEARDLIAAANNGRTTQPVFVDTARFALNNTVNNNTQNNNANNNTNNNTNVTSNNTTVSAAGLYFSVQVGVYKKQLLPAELFNLSPLAYDEMRNGLVRHIYGMYSTPAEAEAARKFCVNAGVKDAFTVAYYNGKQISVGEAKKLMR